MALGQLLFDNNCKCSVWVCVCQNCCTVPIHISVSENRAVGWLLGQMIAKDDDVGKHATIAYTIVGRPSYLFLLHEKYCYVNSVVLRNDLSKFWHIKSRHLSGFKSSDLCHLSNHITPTLSLSIYLKPTLNICCGLSSFRYCFIWPIHLNYKSLSSLRKNLGIFFEIAPYSFHAYQPNSAWNYEKLQLDINCTPKLFTSPVPLSGLPTVFSLELPKLQFDINFTPQSIRIGNE